MPQSVDFVIDPLLTRLAINYVNGSFIADNVAPRLDVDTEYGWYYVFDQNKEAFRIENDLRTGITRANRVDYDLSLAKYGPILEHSLEQGVTNREKRLLGDDVARQRATTNVMQKIMLNHEKMVADMFSDPSIVTQNITDAGTDQWSNTSNTNMFTQVQLAFDTIAATGLDTTGMKKVMLLPYPVWSVLRNLAQLTARMSTASLRTPLTNEMLTALFDVDEIWVANARINTAAKGQSPSISYVWGAHNAWFFYTTGTPTLTNVNPMYTLQLRNPGGGEQAGRYVDSWYEQEVKTEFIRCTDFFEPYMVAPQLVYMLQNVI